MRQFVRVLFLLGAMLLPIPCAGQNVSNYGTISDPFLFLLREPAVQDDLVLSGDQKAQLVELNEQFDGILLATRNMPPEKGQEKVAKVMSETRKRVTKLFSDKQQERLRQITYRLRGISFVLLPYASEQLQLSAEQKAQIKGVVEVTTKELSKLQSKTYQGEAAHRETEQAWKEARKAEQQQIFAVLNDEQKKRVVALVGRTFDHTRLGKVSFKAPELSEDDVWFNSDALQLSDLQGKVVALHFWAFG